MMGNKRYLGAFFFGSFLLGEQKKRMPSGKRLTEKTLMKTKLAAPLIT